MIEKSDYGELIAEAEALLVSSRKGISNKEAWDAVRLAGKLSAALSLSMIEIETLRRGDASIRPDSTQPLAPRRLTAASTDELPQEELEILRRATNFGGGMTLFERDLRLPVYQTLLGLELIQANPIVLVDPCPSWRIGGIQLLQMPTHVLTDLAWGLSGRMARRTDGFLRFVFRRSPDHLGWREVIFQPGLLGTRLQTNGHRLTTGTYTSPQGPTTFSFGAAQTIAGLLNACVAEKRESGVEGMIVQAGYIHWEGERIIFPTGMHAAAAIRKLIDVCGIDMAALNAGLSSLAELKAESSAEIDLPVRRKVAAGLGR